MKYDRVRVYEGLRTAHLERFHVLEPASVVYTTESYDFDASLLDGVDAHRINGLGSLVRLLLRSPIRSLEINEPLMLSATKLSVVAVLAVRLRSLISRRRARIVSYAIGNDDPFEGTSTRLRNRWRQAVFRLAVKFLVSQIDRLAVGTPGALAEYHPYLLAGRSDVHLIPALPTVCDLCPLPTIDDERRGVTFVGAFDERKGLRQLLEAWPLVREKAPDEPLRLLGKGDLAHLAVDAAAHDPTVATILDPSRDDIHRAMREAKVVALLSQPSRTWREQVGLPIVEGLSHGCEIVATTESGLADWLSDHRHEVIDPRPAAAGTIADAVLRALRSTRTPTEVLADLPTEDGRLAADRWMFADA